MKIKKGYVLEILPSLEGLIKIEEKKYIIPYVLPEDEVTFTLKPKKNQGFPIQIQRKESKIQETPLCSYFGKCGGCLGQHIKYEFQWMYKTQFLKEKYKVSFPSLEISNALPPNLYFYRNRMDFVVNYNIVGLRKKNSYKELIDIEECKIQTKSANQILVIFRNLLKKYPIGFDRKTTQGIIKYITIRTANQMGIILTITKENKNKFYSHFIEEFIADLKEKSIDFSLYECYSNLQSEVSNTENNFMVYGKKYLEFSLGGLNFDVPPEGFFQPNSEMIDTMLIKVIKHLSKQNDFVNNQFHLIDLFCGVGTLGLYIYKNFSKNIKSVTGFEITTKSILCAKHNIQKNLNLNDDLDKWNFVHLDLLKKFNIELKERTFLILDPPRSGLSNYCLNWLLSNSKNIDWILYVSCNPNKQFLELEILKKNYELKYIIFGDPFPQTAHWESIAILSKQIN